MKFEEMKKIWDEQNRQPLYVLDEAALHRQVLRRGRRVARWAHINEVGLLLICIITPLILLWKAPDELNSYLTLILMAGIGLYIWRLRWQRRRQQASFSHSVRGQLEAAMANADYLVRQGRTFVWWFLLPLAAITLLNMVLAGKSWIYILFIVAAFVLAYLLVRWELRHIHRPRRQQLEALHRLLMAP